MGLVFPKEREQADLHVLQCAARCPAKKDVQQRLHSNIETRQRRKSVEEHTSQTSSALPTRTSFIDAKKNSENPFLSFVAKNFAQRRKEQIQPSRLVSRYVHLQRTVQQPRGMSDAFHLVHPSRLTCSTPATCVRCSSSIVRGCVCRAFVFSILTFRSFHVIVRCYSFFFCLSLFVIVVAGCSCSVKNFTFVSLCRWFFMCFCLRVPCTHLCVLFVVFVCRCVWFACVVSVHNPASVVRIPFYFHPATSVLSPSVCAFAFSVLLFPFSAFFISCSEAMLSPLGFVSRCPSCVLNGSAFPGSSFSLDFYCFLRSVPLTPFHPFSLSSTSSLCLFVLFPLLRVLSVSFVRSVRSPLFSFLLCHCLTNSSRNVSHVLFLIFCCAPSGYRGDKWQDEELDFLSHASRPHSCLPHANQLRKTRQSTRPSLGCEPTAGTASTSLGHCCWANGDCSVIAALTKTRVDDSVEQIELPGAPGSARKDP